MKYSVPFSSYSRSKAEAAVANYSNGVLWQTGAGIWEVRVYY